MNSLTGQALLNDIHSTQPGEGEVAIWWLGQSGYAIKTRSILLFIDLYFATNRERMMPPPLHGSDLTGVEWGFASHNHIDHIDPDTIPDVFRVSPNAQLILPAVAFDFALNLGLDPGQLIPTRGDETLDVGTMLVHTIPSAHPEFEYSDQDGYPYLGFVFQVDGLSIYHSGDTLLYPGLADRLSRFDLDIAFLPINGTDEERLARNIAPNMFMDEAIMLAQDIETKLLIPHHYDMFEHNTADVNEFIQLAEEAQQPYAVLEVGAKFIWKKS